MAADPSLTGVWAGAAIAGGVSLLAAVIAARTAWVLARERLGHERQLARDARLFDARRSAYAEAIGSAYGLWAFMANVARGQAFDGFVEAYKALQQIYSVLHPIASVAILDALDAWNGAAIRYNDVLLGAIPRCGSGRAITRPDDQAELVAASNAVLREAHAMARLMNSELTGTLAAPEGAAADP